MKQTQINLNEEWAISSDEMNLILRKRQRNKKTTDHKVTTILGQNLQKPTTFYKA